MKLRPEIIRVAEKIQERLDRQEESNRRFEEKFGKEYTPVKLSRVTLFMDCVHKNAGMCGEKTFDILNTRMENIMLP